MWGVRKQAVAGCWAGEIRGCQGSPTWPAVAHLRHTLDPGRRQGGRTPMLTAPLSPPPLYVACSACPMMRRRACWAATWLAAAAPTASRMPSCCAGCWARSHGRASAWRHCCSREWVGGHLSSRWRQRRTQALFFAPLRFASLPPAACSHGECSTMAPSLRRCCWTTSPTLPPTLPQV